MKSIVWISRCLCLLLLSAVTQLHAEDGHELWLRYAALPKTQAAQVATHAIDYVFKAAETPTTQRARNELALGVAGLAGKKLPGSEQIHDGSIVLAVAGKYAPLDQQALPLQNIGNEGFVLRAITLEGHAVIVVAANTDIGLLYGVFELLRKFQLDNALAKLDIVSNPKISLRLLNHWDNLDRKVERGYAGQSLWDWWRLPQYLDARYEQYARANASIGINGTVLNNVNSNARILTPAYLEKVAAIARIMRPWGIKVYLSARFSAPQEIGGLKTSDPLDANVQKWWNSKADEIYQLIPDFGGFLVKANSEGQPGPNDFGRTHADGANMLATALRAHGGVVMWRAFVYSDVNPEDRHKQAWSEFKPLDGKFADNVIVQVKNGAIDFQPREPFHPLFGAMPNTPLMMEFQITKEYLGFATHLVYLGAQYEEVLKADTYAKGTGSLVAKVIDGSLEQHKLSGIAGVANIGSDRDWSGSDFNQANWYAFGRLAWDPLASSAQIARDWLTQTFSSDPTFVETATQLMLRSREAVVDYMTPLGLAHIMGTGHHYGPAPWVSDQKRPEWNPVYYHRADQQGIGFDRTDTGSAALSQYAAAAAQHFADPQANNEQYLLWFRHVSWQYKMHSGRTLWEELLQHYDHGVAEVAAMGQQWQTLEPYVDAERFLKAKEFLQIQLNEAQWWRDACVAYFMSISKLPLPKGVQAPAYNLEYYQALSFPSAPG